MPPTFTRASQKPATSYSTYSIRHDLHVNDIQIAVEQMGAGIHNVREYGATGDGTTSDTTAIQAAITAAGDGGVVYFPPGTYNANVSLSGLSDFTMYGLGFSTVIAPASGIGIAIDTCVRVNLYGFKIDGATKGLDVDNCFDSFFWDLYFADCTVNAIYINGDAGMEQHYQQIVMRGCGSSTTAAFELQRTTTTDAGGLYLTDVHALYGANGKHGFKFNSSAVGTTAIFLWMTTCIADAYVAGPSILFTNVSNITIGTSWFSGIVPSVGIVQINGAYLFRFSNVHFVQVDSSGYCLEYVGGVTESFLSNVTFDGACTTAIKTSASQYNTHLGEYHCYPTNLADDLSNLFRFGSSAAVPRVGATRFVTRGSTSTDNVVFEDADNPSSAAKFFRNNNGTLQIINGAFSSDIFGFEDNGNLFVRGLVAAANVPAAPTDGYLRALPALAGNLTDVTALATNTTYFQYLGKVQHAVGSCTVLCRVTTAAATITWAEVGIFKGSSTAGAAGSLTRLGFTNVAATYNSTGVKQTSVTLTGVAAGDELWVAYGSQATTPFQLRGGLADDIQSGVFQSVSGRVSTVSSPVATAVAGATVVPAWITVEF